MIISFPLGSSFTGRYKSALDYICPLTLAFFSILDHLSVVYHVEIMVSGSGCTWYYAIFGDYERRLCLLRLMRAETLVLLPGCWRSLLAQMLAAICMSQFLLA